MSLQEIPVQSPLDIYKSGVDETKCMAGYLRMTWDLNVNGKSIEALAVVPMKLDETRPNDCFRVFFKLRKEYLEMLTLQPKDEFRLSLRGAKVEFMKEIQRLSTLPMQLVFSEGVHIQWRRKDGELQTLNTWNAHHDDNAMDDDNSWYLSPRNTKRTSTSPRIPAKRNHEEMEKGDQMKEVDNQAKLSKTEKKRQREEKKERSKFHKSSNSIPGTTEENVSRKTCSCTSKSESSDKMESSAASDVLIEPDTSLARLVPARVEAGFRSGLNIYPAIENVRLGGYASLIGIVTNISSPSPTAKGDWMTCVEIVDPSIYDVNPSGMKINCFARRHVEWLPNADFGDVLILRCVKIQTFRNSLVGTGYHDKLMWAACSPPGRIHHGPPNSIPQSEGLAEGGFGVTFSPFYQPTQAEIFYCVRLSDWWRELHKDEPQKPRLSSISLQTKQHVTAKRIHRLISEAGPNVPPDGYFDCTVEVLKGYMAHNGVYSLYVTDYTRNEQIAVVQYNWCPPLLSEHQVLLMEMWDAAAEVGPSMRPGEFYAIKNARMKSNHQSCYLEAKVQQNKITRLRQKDIETNPHLKGLLERKQKWEEDQRNPGNEIQQCLIENFEEGKFFHSTVEILQAMSNTDERPCIYVTDYTCHPNLKSLKVSEPWAQGMGGYIVKIYLADEQQHMAKLVVAGSFYCIRKLRLKYSTVDDHFWAKLGGNEKLIVMLNPNKTDNEHLNGLLRRKEFWERNVESQVVGPKPTSNRMVTPEDCSERNRLASSHTCIKDIPPANAGPMRLEVYARIVSFYPLNLDDAFYQWCRRCKLEIPQTQKACFSCNDFDHDYVDIRYLLHIIIEDEDKEQILVSINNTSPLWDGLKRVRPNEDTSTKNQLRVRLSPLLGNLPSVHEAYNAGRMMEKQTSYFSFELDSWINSNTSRGYGLCRYK